MRISMLSFGFPLSPFNLSNLASRSLTPWVRYAHVAFLSGFVWIWHRTDDATVMVGVSLLDLMADHREGFFLAVRTQSRLE
jgi:hypothetical protein